MSSRLLAAYRLGAWLVCLGVASSGIVAALAAPRPTAFQQAQQPAFRGRLDVVRTEVAVIDNRTGEPVRGLTQSDFAVIENGARQTIASFVELNPTGVTTTTNRPATPRRVFLLVFGAGHLPGPVQPYDGAIEFLRERLGPTDLAAVMVWNRVTELTGDHARLVAVVDRIRQVPMDVLLAVHRDAANLRDVSPDTLAAIDAWIAPVEGPDGFLRNATTALLGTSLYHRDVADAFPWHRRIASRDLLKVYAGIEYLRNVEGQKHLILFSRLGFRSPIRQVDPGAFHESTEDDRRLAAHANDAGVALDIIHTIGTFPAGPGTLPLHFGTLSSQQIATESGGQFTSVRTAAAQLARIDTATRNGYLLGYVPGNPEMDGKYRAVEVQVDRKDVTVVYRRGYTAVPDPPPADPREILTRMRMREGAESVFLVDDVKVTAAATATGPASARQVRVEVAIDPSTLSLARTDGRWTGSIDLMILCSNPQATIAGSMDQRMTLNMSQALYETARASGIPYTASVPVRGPVRRVKVIVYDYASDRLGVANVAVR